MNVSRNRKISSLGTILRTTVLQSEANLRVTDRRGWAVCRVGSEERKEGYWSSGQDPPKAPSEFSNMYDIGPSKSGAILGAEGLG
jgi:hypothetical protein